MNLDTQGRKAWHVFSCADHCDGRSLQLTDHENIPPSVAWFFPTLPMNEAGTCLKAQEKLSVKFYLAVPQE